MAFNVPLSANQASKKALCTDSALSDPAYSQMLKKLYARAPLALGQRHPPSLATMFEMASLLENPQNKYDCIHIAGTNGKGSVATKLANALYHGYNLNVGLLTSPHISCIRERIQVNNEMISRNDFIDGLNEIFECETVLNSNIQLQKKTKLQKSEPIINDDDNNLGSSDEGLICIKANFFEIMTILAYHHFNKVNCDIAVIEVGIGYVLFCF